MKGHDSFTNLISPMKVNESCCFFVCSYKTKKMDKKDTQIYVKSFEELLDRMVVLLMLEIG